jgi:hypothetical protein
VSPPTSGASCPNTAVECEYGTNFDLQCDVLAQCYGNVNSTGTWMLTEPTPSSCSNPDPGVGPGCPANFAAAKMGGVCTSVGLVCDFPEGRCGCAAPQNGDPLPPGFDAAPPPATWACAGPPGNGCPTERPRVGALCSDPNATCFYGACGVPGSSLISCVFGTWGYSGMGPCGGAMSAGP